MVDAGDERFSGAPPDHVPDGPAPLELGNNEIALGVDIVVGRMGARPS